MGISGDLLNLMASFSIERFEKVVLNGQLSEWASGKTGVHQGSILCPLLLLIYINDLFDGVTSNKKLFADDTSIFSTIHDINSSASNLNSDFQKISEWAFRK